MSGKRTVIVGGSIAGCTAAFALRRAGFEVRVLERSGTPLVGRGASIMLLQPLYDRCRQEGLIGAHLPFCRISTGHYVTRTRDDDERSLGSVPWPSAAMHWSDLHAGLRSHVPDDAYRLGVRVETADLSGERVRLGLAGGDAEEADLAVFADGHRSCGRRVVDPDASTDRTNVMLIRGTTPETPADRRMDAKVYRTLYPDGHGVFYMIPAEDGSTGAGQRRVSCSFYLPIRQEDVATEPALAHAGLAGDGGAGTETRLPNDSALLRPLRERWLPPYFADLLRRTPDFFVQPILSIRATRHVRGRACLVGDAGSLFPPYSSSGVFKAVTNALSLEKALGGGSPIPEALLAWEAEQQAADARIAADAERLGRLLIHEVPDLRSSSVEEGNAFVEAIHPGVKLVGAPQTSPADPQLFSR